tara:strand:- start:139 stop:513 length:375 start_codon:yes stop_codon:yes gene_type:complete
MYSNLMKLFLRTLKRVFVIQKNKEPKKVIPLPEKFILKQNRPNPFNPTTRIHYRIPKDTHASIAIFDEKGKKIIVLVDQEHEAGYHHVDWNSRDRNGNVVSGGVYFYQFQSSDYVKTRKMLLLK